MREALWILRRPEKTNLASFSKFRVKIGRFMKPTVPPAVAERSNRRRRHSTSASGRRFRNAKLRAAGKRKLERDPKLGVIWDIVKGDRHVASF